MTFWGIGILFVRPAVAVGGEFLKKDHGRYVEQKHIFAWSRLCKFAMREKHYIENVFDFFSSVSAARNYIFEGVDLWKSTKNVFANKKTEKPLYKSECGMVK